MVGSIFNASDVTNFLIYLHIIAPKTKYGIITAGQDASSIDFAPQKRIKKAANHERNKVNAKKRTLQDLEKNNQYYNKAEFAVVGISFHEQISIHENFC